MLWSSIIHNAANDKIPLFFKIWGIVKLRKSLFILTSIAIAFLLYSADYRT